MITKRTTVKRSQNRQLAAIPALINKSLTRSSSNHVVTKSPNDTDAFLGRALLSPTQRGPPLAGTFATSILEFIPVGYSPRSGGHQSSDPSNGGERSPIRCSPRTLLPPLFLRASHQPDRRSRLRIGRDCKRLPIFSVCKRSVPMYFLALSTVDVGGAH